MLSGIHHHLVHKRRVRVLGRLFAEHLPRGANVLDVGCGDGRIARFVSDLRPDITIRGIEVKVRGDCRIPVKEFDGKMIPFADKSFDSVMFADVLHHTADPLALLGEARRAAKHSIFIKDHVIGGFMSGPILRMMDFAGNAGHGVSLPYIYWSLEQWDQAFSRLGLKKETWITELGIYPVPLDLICGGRLHFFGRLFLR